MSNVNIVVKNKSGATRTYFLFVETPTVSVGDKVYQNVYIAAAPVPSGNGTASFTCQTDYFAVCGTSPSKKLGSKVQVTTADWGIAKINQGGKMGSHFLMKGEPGNAAAFDTQNLKQDCTQEGAFIIESQGFKLGNGARDPADPTSIVPVACLEAQPNTQAFIVPHSTYYISWGTYAPGQIIDVTTIADPAKIDFTGKAASMARVEHELDGNWNITFN